MPDAIVGLGTAIAACAVRHRAALLLTLYEPPSGAGDDLVRVARRGPTAIETAMVETLEAGRASGYLRPGIDLAALANRLCQVLLHVSLGVFDGVRDADQVPAMRCRALLDGIAVKPRRQCGPRPIETLQGSDIGRSTSGRRARTTRTTDFPMLRAVARAEFGRKGYEATTVRDISKAAGLSTGTVYRLIGSKEELLASIMRLFTSKARSAWTSVLRADGTTVEKLDALMWIDINVVDRFTDEYNIQLAWLRESPPSTTNLGSSFTARLRDLKSLLDQGVRAGELRVEGPSADVRAWSLFELLWMPENIVRGLEPRGASISPATRCCAARHTVLVDRGLRPRTTPTRAMPERGRPDSGVGGPGDGLHLEVLVEAGVPVLAADAAGLVAAERHVGAVRGTAVEPDRSGAQPACDRL